MKKGDLAKLEIPWPLPSWCNNKSLESWKQTVLDIRNSEHSEVTILGQTGMGFTVKTNSGVVFYVAGDWVKSGSSNECECTSRDLLTFGHLCGKKAPIDR